MSGRGRHLLAEIGRFLAVGGVATIVALAIFNVAVHGLFTGRPGLLAEHPLAANILANTVGMLISYRGSRGYVFRDRPPVHADGGRTAYFVINIATMTIPVACLWVSRNVLGHDGLVADNVATNVVGMVLGLAARFHLFRTFVFRRPIGLGDLYTEDATIIGPAEPTDPSTSDPVAPPVPGATAG